VTDRSLVHRFDGRVALVTGGASGIGLATAVRLAEEGAKVALVDRDRQAIDDNVTALQDVGKSVRGWAADVTDEPALQAIVAEVEAEFGTVDTLCAAAGILEVASIVEQSLDLWDRTLETNLKGQLLTLRSVLPAMKRRGLGSIVMVSSVSALVGDHDVSAYSASKAGVASLAKQVAAEYAGSGVRCNVVLPGWIGTPFNDVAFESAAERADEVARTVPVGREGTPEEVAALIAFLCSDEASYITGSSVLIDGGLLLGVNG
jgi:NAD(P)-dependent dehydrogenase (short-subunit alcohol dehydrogenase family)